MLEARATFGTYCCGFTEWRTLSSTGPVCQALRMKKVFQSWLVKQHLKFGKRIASLQEWLKLIEPLETLQSHD